MSKKTFNNVRIQTKRDTSANWESRNPILLNGEEIIVDTNAGEIRKKVGDGVKSYTQLPFIDEPIKTAIGNKVDKVTGKELSTNDFTDAYKTKLDGIATGANKYTHPTYTAKAAGLYKVTVDGTGHVSAATAVQKSDITGLGIPAQDTVYTHPDNHPASIITQDTSHKFVTDAQITTWNAKASTAIATTTANGLMSSADKIKLDGIATGANKYTHPGHTAHASGLYKVTVDSLGHVSAATAVVKADITGLGIPAQDTVYTHPTSHPGSFITQDATHRFVSDTEKATWNGKPDNKTEIGLGNVTNDAQIKRSEMGVASGVATLDSAGKILQSQLPSYVDDIVEGYYYSSKFYKEAAHTTVITGETGKIYVDLTSNKTYRWSGTAYTVISETIALGTTSSTAYYGDKGKIAYDHSQSAHAPSNANYYVHPTNHPASIITQDATHRMVSDTQISTWNAKASTAVATTSANGLMSSADKIKLDGIEANANYYIHPNDMSTQHVTTTEKAIWNAKPDTNAFNALIDRVTALEEKIKTAVFYK